MAPWTQTSTWATSPLNLTGRVSCAGTSKVDTPSRRSCQQGYTLSSHSDLRVVPGLAHDVLLNVPLCLSFPASTIFSRHREKAKTVGFPMAQLRRLRRTQICYFLPSMPPSFYLSFYESHLNSLSIYHATGMEQDRSLPSQRGHGLEQLTRDKCSGGERGTVSVFREMGDLWTRAVDKGHR